jgi:hypothetical protein
MASPQGPGTGNAQRVELYHAPYADAASHRCGCSGSSSTATTCSWSSAPAHVVGIAGLAASLVAAFGIDRAGHNGTPALAHFTT